MILLIKFYCFYYTNNGDYMEKIKDIRLDKVIIISILIFMVISCSTIYSAMTYLPDYLGNLALKQLLFYILGFVALGFIVFLPNKWIEKVIFPLYIMGNIHKNIFPFVDFATFTMDKLLCGPQGGVIVYKNEYDSKISTSIFPKTQGGPVQNSLFSKTMCFLKLNSMNVHEYAKTVIDNTNLLINVLKSENIKTINDIAHNHIILVDVSTNGISGKIAEETLFKHGVLVNRNQIPNDMQNALITSGIRIGTVPITNLNYSNDDINILGKYLAAVINGEIPQKETFLYLMKKYHNHINISN